MKKKSCIFFICFLFICLQPMPIFAKETTPADSRLFFLLDKNASIETPTKKPIWVFFSQIDIHAMTGPVYSFFSYVETDQPIEIKTFSTQITLTGVSDADISHRSISGLFLKTTTENGKTILSDTVPPILLWSILSLFNVFVSMSLFALKPSFMEQGSMTLVQEPDKVFKNGVAGYFLGLSLVIIFAIGIVLLPFAILVAFVLYILSMLGEASMAILISYQVAFYRMKKFNTGVYAFCGTLAIELLKNIPIVGWIISWILLPIITIGITVTALINRYFKKRFYETPYLPETNVFHDDKIRDILKEEKEEAS